MARDCAASGLCSIEDDRPRTSWLEDDHDNPTRARQGLRSLGSDNRDRHRQTAVTPGLCAAPVSARPVSLPSLSSSRVGMLRDLPTVASSSPRPMRVVEKCEDVQEAEREAGKKELAETSTTPAEAMAPQTTSAEPPVAAPAVADASLVARGALKSGYLWKMGANVPRWKRRFFVLKPITMLFYYMSEHDPEPRGCIDLDLFDAVRKVGERDDQRKNLSTSRKNAIARSSLSEQSRSTSTAFELYRSGSPDGSGFMLETRGNEDWEHWVEAIANGRHGKMQAEMGVLKGANKLLLEEISGLEQQVATFRGYADQRHVTVLALRDERQRNREAATELAVLADTASSISQLISTELKDERERARALHRVRQRGHEDEGKALSKRHSVTAFSRCNRDDVPGTVVSLQDGEADECGSSAFSNGRSVSTPMLPASASPRRMIGGQQQDQDQPDDIFERAQDRVNLASIRKALAAARAELDRRSEIIKEEQQARIAVERRVEGVERAVKEAEERATAAEGGAARSRGRVSVLERNVEYLQSQQRGLRAELCQARHKSQLARAQKAVLKREVREMWSKQAPGSASSVPSPPFKPTGLLSGVAATKACPRTRPRERNALPRNRTWASMGNLAEAEDVRANGASISCVADVGQSLTEPSTKRRATMANEFSVGVSLERENGEEGSRRRSLRGCMSRTSLVASDGGDTDFADQTASEDSDEDESEDPNSCNGATSKNPFLDLVRRNIRKRAGDPRVPPLPPSRHLRALEAAKRSSSYDTTTADASAFDQHQQQYQQQSEDISGRTSPAAFASTANTALALTGTSTTSAGSGVAGIFLGLRKGMVDMAAQEMGKTLAMIPGGLASVGGSLGSSLAAAGAIAPPAATTMPSADSPQSTTTASYFNATLADAPTRWDCSVSDATTADSGVTGDTMTRSIGGACGDDDCTPAFTGAWSSSQHSPLSDRNGAGPAGAVSEADSGASLGTIIGGGALRRIGSVGSSRTALIQLSDLELAESYGTQVVSSEAAASELSSLSPLRSGGVEGDDAGGLNSGATSDRAGASRIEGGQKLNRRNGGRSLPSLALASVSSFAQSRPALPPRPQDSYELVFTSRVIGLQFKELENSRGVFVEGRNGYVGPTTTNSLPGERSCPDIGDILESYNGVSARGKSAEVVCGELAKCGRPLRLGFRSPQGSLDEDEGEEETWTVESAQEALGGAREARYSLESQGAVVGENSCRNAVAFGTMPHVHAVSS